MNEQAAASPVVLAEPVRQRLVQLASDVLGQLPAEEVPASLRVIAKFTPSKRTRLGAAALAAALDADSAFRDRVADVVCKATPLLADAVRDQLTTSASDPVDVAVVAYLLRPDGWSELIAQLTADWQAAQPTRDLVAELTDENNRLRAELSDARTRLRTATADLERARSAAGDTTSNAETTRLRNTLRIRTNELRAADAAREQADAAADRARDNELAAEAAHGLVVQRLRNRIAELESAAETARRVGRTARDVDNARLRLLLDTMTEAAAGVRRELALPAGLLRPADTVASGLEGGDERGAARDPAALDKLLELPRVHVIVDGYNVTKTGYPELPLADQRNRLTSAMAALQARAGVEITVVFDGATGPPVQARVPRGVRVLFSAPDEIADDLIRRLVAAEPVGRALIVVTSDQAIIADVRRAGAWTAPSAVLLARLG